MPYVDNDIPLATKRKWDDDDDETYNNNSPRTVLSPREGAAPGQQQSFDASSISTTPTTRKTLHPTKRFRPIHQDSDNNDVYSSSHHRREQPSISPYPTHNNKVISLLPCHVCHRRPTKKSDLDSFARCQACREQTCFICMRECQGRTSTPYSSTNKSAVRGEEDKGGEEEEEEEEQALSRSFHMHDVDASPPSIPHTDDDIGHIDVDIEDDDRERRREIYTHHSMICSRCCVEKGAEGEVICLGCLADPCINTP